MIGIGSKVVCVADWSVFPSSNAGKEHVKYPNGAVVNGEVYCVEGFSTTGPILGLIITGKPVLCTLTNTIKGWRSIRFRELSEYRQAQELAYYKSIPVHQPQLEKI